LRYDALPTPWSVVELPVPEDDLGGTFDGKPVDGKPVDGKPVDGKRVDGKRVDGKHGPPWGIAVFFDDRVLNGGLKAGRRQGRPRWRRFRGTNGLGESLADNGRAARVAEVRLDRVPPPAVFTVAVSPAAISPAFKAPAFTAPAFTAPAFTAPAFEATGASSAGVGGRSLAADSIGLAGGEFPCAGRRRVAAPSLMSADPIENASLAFRGGVFT
jgi:hypothetical protein